MNACSLISFVLNSFIVHVFPNTAQQKQTQESQSNTERSSPSSSTQINIERTSQSNTEKILLKSNTERTSTEDYYITRKTTVARKPDIIAKFGGNAHLWFMLCFAFLYQGVAGSRGKATGLLFYTCLFLASVGVLDLVYRRNGTFTTLIFYLVFRFGGICWIDSCPRLVSRTSNGSPVVT